MLSLIFFLLLPIPKIIHNDVPEVTLDVDLHAFFIVVLDVVPGLKWPVKIFLINFFWTEIVLKINKFFRI